MLFPLAAEAWTRSRFEGSRGRWFAEDGVFTPYGLGPAVEGGMGGGSSNRVKSDEMPMLGGPQRRFERTLGRGRAPSGAGIARGGEARDQVLPLGKWRLHRVDPRWIGGRRVDGTMGGRQGVVTR